MIQMLKEYCDSRTSAVKSGRTRLARKLRAKPAIQISENDYYRLLKSLARQKKNKTIKHSRLLYFRDLISNGKLMAVRRISPKTVTMNTAVLVRMPGGKRIQLRLVYPEHENRLLRHISVFSWTGMLLLGKQEGDTLRKGIVVEQILYQPEHDDASVC